MPDKGYKRHQCDGNRCTRCWRNKLKHANKLKLSKKEKKRRKAELRRIKEDQARWGAAGKIEGVHIISRNAIITTRFPQHVWNWGYYDIHDGGR
jgi:hypothetical protein